MLKLEKQQKGIVFGILTLVVTSLQPIISKSRPQFLDPYYYSFTTMLFEFLMFFLLMSIEDHFKRQKQGLDRPSRQRPPIRSILPRLILISMIFAFALPLFYLGFDLTEAVTGMLMIKSSIIFSLIYGSLFLKERITPVQVIFSIILIFGLLLSLTEGSFSSIVFDLGALLLIIVPLMWTIGHGLTKPLLDSNQVQGNQVILVRNGLGAIVLFGLYIAFFPFSNLSWIFMPNLLGSSLLMAITYGLGHFCWYITLTNLPISKAMIIVAPTPITTGLLGWLLLSEPFGIFDILGTLIVLLSISVIMREKKTSVAPMVEV
ncbi:MAG: DMT family transporter [Promethearchaeota archaeon]